MSIQAPLTSEEQAVRDEAIQWARANRTKFAADFTNIEKYPGEIAPVALFMAGSPGAGKTEASKALAEEVGSFLRIDPDDFRAFVPGYDGQNSWLVQDAVTMLVERVLDRAFKQKQSFLLDGTLSSLAVADRNVGRCVDRGRSVQIIYVYQEPALAWNFVNARELKEGRRIPPERFVHQFFASRDVVNALKVKFGQSIKIDVIIKDIDGTHRRYHANVSDLNHVAPLQYSKEEVEKIVRS
ncbi:zeta toxin family protein [Variovorax sp. LjRoot84]|uniref:zeta toxin family protein n=1 Tax=Variovorax sp. LjRoot84 TaxID=3342340 RepID=UPI003ED0949B